jgi:heme exporter protein A
VSLHAIDIGCIRGELSLFEGVHFCLSPGEALRVTGRNGAGKSSLLRILCGLAEPSVGEVRWQDNKIQRVREQYHASLVYIGHASGIKDELLAWENLAMAATMTGGRIDMRAACEALDHFGLSHVADLPARMLSQGQRKRVALARLHLGAHRLWILDEPFNALDGQATQELREMIERHLAGGGMLVYCTHQDLVLKASRHDYLDLEALRPCGRW